MGIFKFKLMLNKIKKPLASFITFQVLKSHPEELSKGGYREQKVIYTHRPRVCEAVCTRR